MSDARNVLADLLPPIEEIYAKSTIGSSQRTLMERRKKALELAVQAIDGLPNEKFHTSLKVALKEKGYLF